MMILVVLVLAVLLALLRGGNIGNLGLLKIRWRGLFITGFLIQVLIFSEYWQIRADLRGSTSLVYFVSLVMVLVAMTRNLHLPGMWLVLLGFCLNLLVIALNGGYMPSSAGARALAGRIPLEPGQVVSNSVGMGSHTPLFFLGDVFAIPAQFLFPNVFSIGDVMIAIGAVYLIDQGMRGQKK